MAEDDDAREAGIIVDTDGSLGSGTPKALELIHHIVTEFSSTFTFSSLAYHNA